MRNGDFYLESPRGPIRYCKFYFEHFSLDQQQRFVELYNQRKLRFNDEYGFYRMPFFMKSVE